MPTLQPLLGIRVLVTRAQKQADALSSRLEELGADVVAIPTIEIRPPASYAVLDDALSSIGAYDWLILTSINGVESLFVRMEARGASVAALKRVHIAAIGPATRHSLETRGLKVEVVPKNYIAEDVVAALRDRVGGQRVLLVRAKIARDVIPRELARAGATVDVVEAYETGVPEGAAPALAKVFGDPIRRPQVVCLTSSSTAQNLLAIAPNVAHLIAAGQLLCACIGPVTSQALLERGLRVAIEAKEYTVDGLIQAIAEHFTHKTQ